MITEWFIDLLVGFAEWFLTLLPDMDWADGMVVDASNAMSSVMVAAASISAWFPWGVLFATANIVLGCYVALFALKFARWLWGLTPFSGGS